MPNADIFKSSLYARSNRAGYLNFQNRCISSHIPNWWYKVCKVV